MDCDLHSPGTVSQLHMIMWGNIALAIDVRWDTDQTQCLVITYSSPWTWEEFDSAYTAMIPMLDDAADKKVTLIIDIRKGGFPPPDALPRFKGVVETRHPNVTQLIFIAPGALAHFVRISLNILRRVYRTVGRANPPEFQFVASLEEARALSQSAESASTSS